MEPHRCKGCAAPLPAAVPGTIVRCGFCGAEYLVPAESAVRPEPVRPAGSRLATRLAAFAGCLFLLSGIAVAVALGPLAFLVGARSAAPPAPPPVVVDISIPGSPGTPSLPLVPTPRPSAGERAVTPSELAGMPARLGWFPLEAPGMEGTWDRFDPVANTAWLLGIARAWSTDARIELAFAEGVREDGTMDLSARDDREYDIRFFSPTLRETARKAAEVSEQSVASEFRISVERSGMKAMISSSSTLTRQGDPPDFLPTCPTARLMETWIDRGLPRRPSYELALQWIEGTRDRRAFWRWTISGDPSFERGTDLPSLSPDSCDPLR